MDNQSLSSETHFSLLRGQFTSWLFVELMIVVNIFFRSTLTFEQRRLFDTDGKRLQRA